MLIPYLGHKGKLANFIVPNIPTNISNYVEPFGGGFGIFFALDFTKFKNINFIYNDKNNLNYLLFKNLKNPDFIELFEATEVDKEYYRSCLKNMITEKDEMLLSLYWLVVLTCSSPYEIGKDSWTNNSEFNILKMKYKAYSYHLSKINGIYNLDYKDIINKYDSESTFFYVDPPYMGKEEYYINHDFNKDTHKELSEVLNNIRGKFLLSYYYFDGIEDLYPNCKFDSKITIMGTELIIMNY
jgi:DNA adenine methylase